MTNTATTTAPDAQSRFPHWILLGGLILALGYLPSLNTPFDFIDDGNLVYPAPSGLTANDHVVRWWDKVRANVTHLGPFRPVLWMHWEVFANTFGGDVFTWRVSRLVWCGFAATMLLWLLRELKINPIAALVTTAAAMWNPYRNEIWTSLTLAEGVAMPYAILALIAARKAAQGSQPGRWDALAIVGFLAALGCKNTFVALLPAMLTLRILADGLSLREALLANRWRASIYLLPLLMPAVHFVYFKLNWQPGQYETPGPSFAQLTRIALWLKGAAGLDFLGVGLLATFGALVLNRTTRYREIIGEYRALLIASGCLFIAGVAVYLPMPMMAARYTMPAVWGCDLALALLLTIVLALPQTTSKTVALATVFIGLGVMMFTNVGRQEKFAARSRVLWDALDHLEKTAPPNARVAWISGETSGGALNAEEGIHFQWHLLHRGRGDIRIGLVNETGHPIPRVELPPLIGEPEYRLAMKPVADTHWDRQQEFAAAYWLGRKKFQCQLDVTRSATPYLDSAMAGYMANQFNKPTSLSDAQLLQQLTNKQPLEGGATTAELRKKP